MKDRPRKTQVAESSPHLAAQAAQKDHITPEILAGQGARTYRRTTVTVERETLSVYTRRRFSGAVAGPVVAPPAYPAGGEIAPQTQDETQPGATPETPKYLSAGKP